MKNIEKVLVIGSGLMGGGIAQVCAQAGLEVLLYDNNSEAVNKALKTIAWSVGKLVEKGKVQGDAREIVGRISPATDLKAAGQVDLCIEAVYENIDLKRDIFRELDRLAGPETLLASNTSAISISELAAVTGCPERVVGLHFFSPVPMMGAAEVVMGLGTAEETFEAGREFISKVGKTPIPVRRDIPGFVINRINFRANMEAMRLVEEGVASCAEIDAGLRLASGRKMGPFEIGDMVGLDVTLGALTACYNETRDPAWYPPAILRRKVAAGQLGRKTGRGWYEYNEDGSRKDQGGDK